MTEIGPDTDISASVGRRGVNRPADVSRIKTFLNAISTELGGTDGTLIEADTAASGSDFEALVKAINIFQQKNFAGWFPPDGLVERRRNTHKALVRMGKRSYIPVLPEVETIVPVTGLVLDTDGQGYSRAGLKKATPTGDWIMKVANANPIQMVPVGGNRTLRVTAKAGAIFTFALGGARPEAVKILSTSPVSVTLIGVTPGEAELHVVGYTGVVATAIIRVRARAAVRVNTVHVGRPRTAGAENNFAKILPAISRLYEPQTNVVFEAGSTSIMQKLNGVDVDPAKPITDITDYRMAPGVAKLVLGIEQPFSLTDLGSVFPSQGSNVLTIFFSDALVKFQKPLVLGSAEFTGGRLAWFRLGSSQNQSVSEFMVPAHEIGHLLGYEHITAPGSDTYLMNRTTALNNMRIPSDTLTELRV